MFQHNAHYKFAFAGTLIATSLLLIITDSLNVRFGMFGSSSHCYYQLAIEFPADLDLLLIGSSRTRRGILPDQLGKLLGSDGNPASVINFGHPYANVALDLYLLNSLTRHHRVRHVLIEAYLDENPDGYDAKSMEQFTSMLSYRQIMQSLHDRSQPILMRVYTLLNQLKIKITRSIQIVLSGRILKTLYDHDQIDWNRTNICWTRSLERAEKGKRKPKYVAEMEDSRREFLTLHASWFDAGYYQPRLFSEHDNSWYVSALQKMVEFAKRRHIEIIFYYLPGYYDWPPSPEFAKEFHKQIGAPIIYPDKALLRQLQNNGYQDASHLTPRGREFLTPWLATSIRRTGWTP